MNQGHKLPDGWKWVRLGDVCDTTSGGTPSRGNATYYGGCIPWVKSGELNDGWIIQTEERLTLDGLANSSAKLFPSGTLLIALYGATVGKLGILQIEAATNQAICGIFVNKDIERDYLFLYLLQQRNQLTKSSFGGAQPNINQSIINSIKIPLPPLPEQKRIAAILTEQITAVEKARKAAQEQLEAAKQLTNAYLNSVFNSDEAKGWKRKRLGDIAQTSSGTTPSRDCLEYYNGEIPWVKTGELKDNLIENTEEYISQIALEKTSLQLLPIETLLIAMYGQGQTRGRTGVLKMAATTNQACFAIRPNYNEFSPYYLQLWFRYNYSRLRQETEGRGGNQSNLNGDILDNQIISLPKIEIQKRIADYLSKKLTEVERLKQTLQEQLKVINQLSASLLSRAFRGEL